MRRKPSYPSESDYTTNAPSYYDDLARKNKLIEILSKRIYDYDQTLASRLNNLDQVLDDHIKFVDGKIELVDHKIGEGFNDEINTLLVDWVNDGTLNHIINVEIFNTKADKTELEDVDDRLSSQLAHTVKVVNVKEFGAIGDGVTDDRQAIQNAVDSVDSGVIFIPNGIYYLSDSVIINKDNIKIIGDVDTWLDAKANHTINGLIRAQGNIISETLINTDLTRGQTTPPVAVASDYVIIKTVERYNDERTYYRKGEIVKSENNLFIDQLSDDYVALGNSLTLQEIKLLKNIEIKNIKLTKDFSTNSENNSKGIVFELAADSKIENIYGHHFDHAHVYIDRCYNVDIDFTKFEDGSKEAGLCYGVHISNSCRFIDVNHINGKRLRHLTAFGCTGLGLPRHSTVNHAHDSHSYAMSFDVHNIAEDITYNHCVGEGYQSGGTRTTFNDCYFREPIYGELFYLRLTNAIDLSFNRCVFDGLIGTYNRSDTSKKFDVSFNQCYLIVDDSDFKSVSKYDNISVNMSNTTIKSHIKPIVDNNNLITNKKKVEFRFGENSVFNNNTFENLIDVFQIMESDVTFNSNKFIDTYGYEIALNSLINDLKNIKINDNLFETLVGIYSGSGRSVISSKGDNTIKSLTISNNTIETNQQSKKAITLDNVTESVVNGNVIYSTGFGIELTSTTSNNVVTGNVITSDGNSIVDNGTNVVANNYERFPI